MHDFHTLQIMPPNPTNTKQRVQTRLSSKGPNWKVTSRQSHAAASTCMTRKAVECAANKQADGTCARQEGRGRACRPTACAHPLMLHQASLRTLLWGGTASCQGASCVLL